MPSAKQSWHASHFSNGRCKIGQTVSTCTQTCMHMHCMHFIVSRDTKNEVLLCALHPTSKHNTDTMKILDRHRFFLETRNLKFLYGSSWVGRLVRSEEQYWSKAGGCGTTFQTSTNVGLHLIWTLIRMIVPAPFRSRFGPARDTSNRFLHFV